MYKLFILQSLYIYIYIYIYMSPFFLPLSLSLSLVFFIFTSFFPLSFLLSLSSCSTFFFSPHLLFNTTTPNGPISLITLHYSRYFSSPFLVATSPSFHQPPSSRLSVVPPLLIKCPSPPKSISSLIKEQNISSK